ncbi:MAG TPA: YbaN family protein [Bacteroidales bacterium]|nr:YbaN family protein [Bacteroidales bacterium]
MKKALLIIAGCVSLGLGLIGILVPLLPTTPFLLLAAACFLRSSDRLYNWLLQHRLFGKYLRSYYQHKAIPLKIKYLAIGMIWISIGSSVVFLVDFWLARIILLIIATFVTVHIARMRTLTKEMAAEFQNIKSTERHSQGSPDSE